MPELTPKQALEVAQNELQAGRLVQSESLCRQVLGVDPRNATAIGLLARIAFVTGHAAQSAGLLREAITIEPGNSHNYGNLGSVLAQLGQLEDAVAAFRQALSMNPGSVETHANLANAFMTLGRYDDAVEISQRALKIDPNASGVYNNLANALIARGDVEGSIAAIRRAIETDPTFAEGYSNLGNLLRRAKRPAEPGGSSSVYRAAPNVPEAHAGAAATLLEMGRVSEAIDRFKAAMEVSPGFCAALLAWGRPTVLPVNSTMPSKHIAWRRAWIQITPMPISIWDWCLLIRATAPRN